MVLHGAPDDPSARYIQRMQQAVRVLYGSASPSEAFQSTQVTLAPICLNEFLRHVADNAPAIGIENVQLRNDAASEAIYAEADEYSLEDVITHVLQNAQRFRPPGSPILVQLEATPSHANIAIANLGPAIDESLIDKIFEYGVSGSATENGTANASRGQGLYVAKTYMAKMGGTITASNTGEGVRFVLTLPRTAKHNAVRHERVTAFWCKRLLSGQFIGFAAIVDMIEIVPTTTAALSFKAKSCIHGAL
jgi:signal transduction histidine kinase